MAGRSPAIPTELEALLLHAALAEGDDAPAAWERWKRAGGDIDGVDNASFRTLPLLYSNLLRAGYAGDDMTLLKGVYRHAWSSNQRLFHLGGRALDALAEAGLETLVLKGVALSRLHYSNPGTRPMNDFDVLVRTRSASEAIEVLRRAGWELRSEGPVDRLVRVFHAASLADAHGSQLDLHWRAVSEPARDDDLWDAAIPLEVAGRQTLALAPTDLLMHVLVHGLGLKPALMRWVTDSVVVARTAPDGIDWHRLADRAVARRVTRPVATGLRYLSEEFGLAVPTAVLDELEGARTTISERIRPADGGRAGTFVAVWDRYHRLRTVDHESPVPHGYLRFLADYWGLPTRRRLVPYVARKAVGRRA